MKSKTLKLFLSAILFFNIYRSYSQVERLIPSLEIGECGTSEAGPVFRFTTSQLNDSKFLTNQVDYVFNVKLHYIFNNVLPNEQELYALDLVGALNLFYNDSNIYFKFIGYDNIDNSDFLNVTNENINNLVTSDTNNIDIYICNLIKSNNGIAGSTWNWTIGNLISKKAITLKKEYLPVFYSENPSPSDFKYYTIIHEVGHYLGLHHTHLQWQYIDGVLSPASDSDCGIEENLDNSQWNILGDLIQDTNPDRIGKKYWIGASYLSNCAVNTSNYVPNAVCNTSINLSQFNPPMHNIMAYYHTCRTGFTQGQTDFMRAYIDSNSNGGFLTNKLNEDGIQSLYQPFSIVAISENQSGNTTAAFSKTIIPNIANTGTDVVNCPIYTFRFQKGLNYKFTIPNIGIVSKTPNEQFNYTLDNTLIDVNIPVFGSNAFQTGGIDCFTSFEPYIKGTIKSLSNLASSIITFETLDQIKASNPNLYDQLQSQEYHIITKETTSGYIDQKVIYKN